MTRKHFVALAGIVQDGYATAKAGNSAAITVFSLELAITDFCAGENPNFDADRFKRACRGKK